VSTRNYRKIREGTVVSTKMDKTLVVRIDRTVRHPLYNKFVTRSRKVHAHNENAEVREGDFIRVMETRPLSRTKRWRYLETVRKAQ